MKTYSAKPSDVTRKWYILDASEVPLGRLSTVAASLLIGKGRPSFTSHIDVGDFVIVINSDQLVVTGNKADKKIYYRHSGYPGGIYKKHLRGRGREFYQGHNSFYKRNASRSINCAMVV